VPARTITSARAAAARIPSSALSSNSFALSALCPPRTHLHPHRTRRYPASCRQNPLRTHCLIAILSLSYRCLITPSTSISFTSHPRLSCTSHLTEACSLPFNAPLASVTHIRVRIAPGASLVLAFGSCSSLTRTSWPLHALPKLNMPLMTCRPSRSCVRCTNATCSTLSLHDGYLPEILLMTIESFVRKLPLCSQFLALLHQKLWVLPMHLKRPFPHRMISCFWTIRKTVLLSATYVAYTQTHNSSSSSRRTALLRYISTVMVSSSANSFRFICILHSVHDLQLNGVYRLPIDMGKYPH